jgi:hypothetical protein
MKFLLIATLIMSVAYADEKKEANLDEVKQRIAANIDQKISALQAHKGCVQGASSKEALRECRNSHKAAMKKLHEENKGEKEDWKAVKKAEREKRKSEKKSGKSKK